MKKLKTRDANHAPQPDGFGRFEIPCLNREAAEAEAKRQQELQTTDEAEWIYLRNKDRQWVARRTSHNTQADPTPPSRWRTLREAIIDNLHIEDLFS
jgi:hypothetical protein